MEVKEYAVLEGGLIPLCDSENVSINMRRTTLFRASLSIMLLVSLIFIPINISIGLHTLAGIEAFFAIFAAVLIKLVRNPAYFDRCRYLFVGVAAVWALAASISPSTSSTVFVWNALFLPYAFFLLGRKKALVFCCAFVPLVMGTFVYSHMAELKTQSVETIANIVIFTICLFAFCLFYEVARSGIEVELVDDIKKRKAAENKNLVLIDELQIALGEVKRLSGLLPICASCKKIRDDNGYWSQVEVYVEENSDAEFSHGLCPCCVEELYPDLEIDLDDLYKDELPR